MRALRYALSEAGASLWRGRRSGILSVATITLAFFVLGAFLILTVNLERLVAQWGSAADLSVYLTDDVSEVEQRAIEALISPGSVVAGHEYVSKDQALARFKQTFTELAGSITSVGDNPLPASFNVRLVPGVATTAVETLAAHLRETPGVADVRYDRQWADRLMSAVSLVRAVGIMLGVVLTLAAAFTVATVVRLALVGRRDELDIMELVGAPAAYVQGPFVMEGVLQGGIGAMGALVSLAVLFFSLRSRVLLPLASAINLDAVHFLPVELWVLLVLGGMVVGCAGGYVAAWGR